MDQPTTSVYSLSGSDGSLSFWLKLGGLPTGADCRLVRGALDGVWRYYEVTSKGNTSIGEGTLRAPLDDIPKDDYVLTPTGGFQVEYQCCPQQLATESPQLAVDVDPQVQEESTNTAMIAVALSGAVVLFISIVVICVIQRWKPGILRSRRYEAFPEKMTTPQQNVEKMQPNPGKVMLGNRASEITSSKAATWNSSWSPAKASAKLGGGAVEQSPAGGATLLPSAKNADRRAVAVADVLGKASTTSDDGIYEGPTRQWWGGSSSSGRGGTGFQPGARVRLQGLTASSWNGAEGIIEGWDAQKGAFEVKVNGTLKLVKPDNLVVSPAAGRAGEGDLTPAQLRMKLNAAQVNQLSQGPERSSPSAPRVEVGRQRQRAAQPGFGDTSQIHKALARPRAGERDERQLPGPSIASGSGDHLRSAGNWRSHAPAPPPRPCDQFWLRLWWCSPVSCASMELSMFNVSHGFTEAVARGLRSGFLGVEDYRRLGTCDTLEDMRSALEETDYGTFLQDGKWGVVGDEHGSTEIWLMNYMNFL
eukprot:s4327_g2.t1